MATANKLTPELLRVLWACHAYWLTETLPEEQRAVCFSWVEGIFRQRFGVTFHQTMLATLAKHGLLIHDNTSQGGNRRYYRLSNPQSIHELVAELDLA
jgi:hypothetical protein